LIAPACSKAGAIRVTGTGGTVVIELILFYFGIFFLFCLAFVYILQPRLKAMNKRKAHDNKLHPGAETDQTDGNTGK